MRVWNTRLKNFRRCRRKWYFGDVLNLGPREPFRTWLVGEMGHLCQEKLYCTGEVRVEGCVTEVLRRYEMVLFDEEIVELVRLLADIMNRYVCTYAEHDQSFIKKILGVEHEFAIPLSGGIILEGVFDLVVLDHQDRIHIWDHKFTGTPHQYKHILLDPQASTYFFAGETMFGNVDSFTLNNILSKRPPKKSKYDNPCFHREHVRRNTYEQGLFIQETIQQAREMQKILSLYEEGMPVPLYRTPTKDCHWDCEFYTMCITEMKGGDIEYIMDLKYVRKPERIGRG